MNVEKQNMDMLRQIYDAYKQGNVDLLMSVLADDFVMDSQADTMPWGGQWKGPAGMQDFLKCVGEELDHQEYVCEDMIGRDETVVSWGWLRTCCRKSEKTSRKTWMHRTVFEKGRIKEIHEYYDSLGFAVDTCRAPR